MAAPAAEKDPNEKGMDPLKAYCIVLGLLIGFLGFLYFKFAGERADYEAANARAEPLLTGKGMAKASDGRPLVIPELAYDVERFVATYRDTAKEGPGAVGGGIPQTMMAKVETDAGVEEERALREQVDEKKDRGYKTITQQFDYKPTNLQRLLALAYNIEGRGRYRVSDIRWQLAEPKDNSEPPFNRISKPMIKVSVRSAIAKER
jgi:hypothetical protein